MKVCTWAKQAGKFARYYARCEPGMRVNAVHYPATVDRMSYCAYCGSPLRKAGDQVDIVDAIEEANP